MHDRRTLLAALAASGLASCYGPSASIRRRRRHDQPRDLVAPGDVVLFQGDSITDAGRDRARAAEANRREALGDGWAWRAASALLVRRPTDDLRFFNRGVSGDEVPRLAARWDADCLALAPDVVSVLIGVNDYWHLREGTFEGTVDAYERDFHALIERTHEALPEVELVVCEPFVLPCGVVDASWFPAFDAYREAAARVAEEHGAAWVPFHAAFREACRWAPPEHWAPDGVHPSQEGAALMASTWLHAVGA